MGQDLMHQGLAVLRLSIVIVFYSSLTLGQGREILPVLKEDKMNLPDWLSLNLSGIVNGYKIISFTVTKEGIVEKVGVENVLVTDDLTFASSKNSEDISIISKLKFKAAEENVSLKLKLFYISNEYITPECSRNRQIAINALRLLYENEMVVHFPADKKTGNRPVYIAEEARILLRPVKIEALE